MEGVDEAVGRSLDSVVADLRTNLSGLATIVGIAPFLGLCGTVLGLMDAFAGLESAGDFPKVVDGISAALATTVFGLFVAMPSLWAYNYFMNRIDVMALDLENTGARIVSHVVRRAIRQRLSHGATNPPSFPLQGSPEKHDAGPDAHRQRDPGTDDSPDGFRHAPASRPGRGRLTVPFLASTA